MFWIVSYRRKSAVLLHMWPHDAIFTEASSVQSRSPCQWTVVVLCLFVYDYEHIVRSARYPNRKFSSCTDNNHNIKYLRSVRNKNSLVRTQYCMVIAARFVFFLVFSSTTELSLSRSVDLAIKTRQYIRFRVSLKV